jgi:hypothetical protein
MLLSSAIANDNSGIHFHGDWVVMIRPSSVPKPSSLVLGLREHHAYLIPALTAGLGTGSPDSG